MAFTYFFRDFQTLDMIRLHVRMFHDSLETGGFFVTEQTQKMPDKVKGLWQQVVSNAQVFRKADIANN